jgi:DNA-binding MarR family transcriptional regulator
MTVAEAPVADWIRLVRAEYDEMPGLVLTCAQIRRMWGIDSDTCVRIMSRLVAEGFVVRRADGSYSRPSPFHVVRQSWPR